MKCLYSDFSGMINCAWLGFAGVASVFITLGIVAIILIIVTGGKK